MGKLSNLRRKILKFLSQAAAQPAAMTFQSPPPSPRKTSSGPIISIIPKEAREKGRNGLSFATREPTSPKVSCMGQVQGRKKKKSEPKPKQASPPPQDWSTWLVSCIPKGVKQNPARIFKVDPKGGSKQGINNNNNNNNNKHDGVNCVGNSSTSTSTTAAPERVPSLGQMKRFTNGRGVLSGFDLEADDDDLSDRITPLRT